MKRGSTFILRGAVTLMGAAALALCIFWVPWLAGLVARTRLAYLRYPIYIDLYAAAIPFFLALHQTLKLLGYIDKNIAFSELSVMALKKIKMYTFAMSAVLMAGMPVVYLIADADDAPGLILIAFAFACVPLVIATFASVLQRLLQEAIDIKSENDLII